MAKRCRDCIYAFLLAYDGTRRCGRSRPFQRSKLTTAQARPWCRGRYYLNRKNQKAAKARREQRLTERELAERYGFERLTRQLQEASAMLPYFGKGVG